MVFGLACGDVLLHGRIFFIKIFSYAIVKETYSAANTYLIAVITRYLVYKLVWEMVHLSLVHVATEVL